MSRRAEHSRLFRRAIRAGCRIVVAGVRNVLLVSLLIMCGGWESARGAVEGRIAQTGFASEAGPCFREGRWCPLRVDLTLRGESTFQGVLRVIQTDTDGDRIISEREVGLSGEGVTRSFWIYSLPDMHGDEPFLVQLLDEQGAALMFDDGTGGTVPQLVERMPAALVNHEVTLVLDMSERALSQFSQSVRVLNNELRGSILLARTIPMEIPPAWYGLEMIDAIVWDAADPSKLDFTQIDALIGWVQHGGHLIIAAGRTAGTLKQSRFDELLPVDIGSARQVDELPDLQTKLLGFSAQQSLPEPVTVCNATIREGALQRFGTRKQSWVGTSRVGMGRITFVSAELADLISLETERGRLLGGLLGMRLRSPEPEQRRFAVPVDLFSDARQTVDFVKRTGALMGLAILFVVGYALTATVVSWHWLKRRDWKHHNWTAFSIVVLAASGLSLAAVQIVRGIGTDLHELSIVDLDVDSATASGTSFFGVKTASHTKLDLWLPGSADDEDGDLQTGCTLQPMPPGPTSMMLAGTGEQRGFLSPLEYTVHAGRAMLEDVPFRATLKQFVGQWTGPVQGSFRARIELDRGTVLDSSWLENNLDETLLGCYLIVARLDPKRERKAEAIEVYDVGTIEPGERIERLGAFLEDRLLQAKGIKSPGDNEPVRPENLGVLMDKWIRDLTPSLVPGWLGEQERRIDPNNYDKALLLLSTLAEYDELTGKGQLSRPNLLPGYCRSLDRSDSLSRRTAMLVGFSKGPGPVRLYSRNSRKKNRDFSPLIPSEARTMYRIFIPVE